MVYEKQNFEDGQVLKAEHLNKIEDELARAKSWNDLTDKPFGWGEPTILLDHQTVTLTENACEIEGFEIQPDMFYELELDGVKHQCYPKEVDILGIIFTGIGNVEGALDGTIAEGEFALVTNADLKALVIPGVTECTVSLVERPIIKIDEHFVRGNLVELNIFNADPYLYTGLSTKISRDELVEIVKSGSPIAICHPFGIYTIQYPALIRFGDENYATVWVVSPSDDNPAFDTYYTSEYVAETTES